MPRAVASLAALLLLAANAADQAAGCSDFLFNSSSDSVVSGRTMDFAVDLKTVLEVIPRGTVFHDLPVAKCPHCPDFEWTSRFGFVGLNAYGMNVATDGLNEKGLSAAWLYLVGSQYPSPETPGFNESLPVVTSVPSYILGNFASVDEVREGLGRVQLAGYDDEFGTAILKLKTTGSAPLHVSVHDAHGKSLVIEFLNGKTVFYDNVNQVMTNDPPLNDHLTELTNRGLQFEIDSSDIPGGYGSKERFLRLSLLNHRASEGYYKPPSKASYLVATEEQRVVSDTLHLLNTVVRPPPEEATEWSVVRDHGRRMLYVQSTQNQLLRRVDLNMLDFADRYARRFIPVTFGNWFFDITLPLMDDGNKAKTLDVPPRSKIEELLEGHGGSEALASDVVNSFTASKRPQPVAIKPEAEADVASLSTVPVFIAGCLCGMIVPAAMFVGWKISNDMSRRRGYHAI